MKLFGYIKELVSLWYKKDGQDIKIEPKSSNTFTTTTTISIPKPDSASDDIVLVATAQTLTNKTLTSPTLNNPIISGGTIDDAVIGGVTPDAGTFTTLAATSATVGGSDVLTTDNNKVVTNKTIDSDNNTITNIVDADIKASAAIARTKIANGTADHVIINNGSGTLSSEATLAKSRGGTGQDNSSLTFPASGEIVEKDAIQTLTNKTHTLPKLNENVQLTATSAELNQLDGVSIGGSSSGDVATIDGTQTLTNKTIDGDNNTVQDLALASLKTNLTDASKFLVRDINGEVVSNSKAVPSGVVVGTTDSQILTNKTIDSDNNTITNIVDADIKASAAITRAKLATGSADHVLINNGSGVMTSEATLSKSRGGSGQDNSGLTFPVAGTLATLSGAEAISNKTITLSTVDSTPIGNSTPSTGNFTDLECDTIAKDGGETFILPATRGASNQVLQLSSAVTGQLGWATVSTDSLAEKNVKVGNNLGLAISVDTNALGDVVASTTGGFEIKSNTIVDADINANADIDITKIEKGTANQVLRTNSGATANEFSLLGPENVAPSTANYVLKTNAGATANEFGQIVDASVATSAAIAITKLANGTSNQVLRTNSGGTANEFSLLDPTNISPSTAHYVIKTNAGATANEFGQVVDASIDTNAAIAVTKLAIGTADQVLKTNSGGTANEFGKIGDANIAVAGAGADAYKVLKVNAGGTAVDRGLIDNNNVDAAAGIAISKLGVLTANRMVQTNSSTGALEVSSFSPTQLHKFDVIIESPTTDIATVINAAGNNKHIYIKDSLTLDSTAVQDITVSNCSIELAPGVELTINAPTGGLKISGNDNFLVGMWEIVANFTGTLPTLVQVSGSDNLIHYLDIDKQGSGTVTTAILTSGTSISNIIKGTVGINAGSVTTIYYNTSTNKNDVYITSGSSVYGTYTQVPDLILRSVDVDIAAKINAIGDGKFIYIAESISVDSTAIQTITVSSCVVECASSAILTISASTGGIKFTGSDNIIKGLNILFTHTSGTIARGFDISGSNNICHDIVITQNGAGGAITRVYDISGTGTQNWLRGIYKNIAGTQSSRFSITGASANEAYIMSDSGTQGRVLYHTSQVAADLTADSHTQYALLAGRSGGQSLTGGTAASNNLTLTSTSNATKGDVVIAAGTGLKMNDGGSFYARFIPGTMTESTDYTLPVAKPSGNNDSLTSSTAGVLAWKPMQTKETGFDNRTDSTITFTDSTRTFNISGTYTYYMGGVRYNKVGVSENLVIANTVGNHAIYYNGSTLEETTAITDAIITTYAFVCLVYWNGKSGTVINDERHGNIMDSATHVHLHTTFGTRYETGLATTVGSNSGDGNTDSHAQISVTDGEIHDEDISFVITDGSPQQLSPLPAQIPVIYRSGASGDWLSNRGRLAWVNATIYTVGEKIVTGDKTFVVTVGGTSGGVEPVWAGVTTIGGTIADNTVTWAYAFNINFPVMNKYDSVNFRLAYNQFTGGAWTQTEITNGNYVITHLFATTDIRNPIIAIQGQAEYSSLANAQTGAANEISSISTGNLPMLEWVPLYSIIFQTGNAGASYTNLVHARVRGTLQDFRLTRAVVTAGVASNHSLLSNLNADDHAQYALLGGRSGGQTLIGGTGASEALILSSTANLTKGGVTIATGDTLKLQSYAATPTIHSEDPDSGIVFPNIDEVQLHTNGINRFEVTNTMATFSGNVTVSGDLTVLGSSTIVDTTTYQVEDNIITVNSGETGAGVAAGYGGLDVDRGTLYPYSFRFEESSDTFRVGETYTTITYSSLTGGPFAALEDVNFSPSGAKGKIISDNGTTTMVVRVKSIIQPDTADAIAGVTSLATADVDTVVGTDTSQAVATRQNSPQDKGVPYWNDTDKRFDTEAALQYDASTNTMTVNNLTVSGTVDGVDVSALDSSVTNHLNDTSDPHGSTTTFSVAVSTPKVSHTNSINVDMVNGSNTVLSVTNTGVGDANVSIDGLTASRVLTADGSKVITSATMTTSTLDIVNDMAYNKSWTAFSTFATGDQIYIKDDITVGANIDINQDNVHIKVKPGKTINFGDYELTISGNNVRIDNGIWEFSTTSRDLITISGSRNYINNMIVKWNDGAVDFTAAVIDIASNAQNNRGNVCIYKAGTGTVSGSEGVQDNSGKTSNTIICTIEE